MKLTELKISLFEDCDVEEKDDLGLQWDEVDAQFNQDQFEVKEKNKGLEKEDEDQPKFSNKPESEEMASNGHRGMKAVTRYL